MARVLLFGPLVDIAGWRERDIDVPALSSLKAFLAWEEEGLGAAIAEPGVQVSIDQEITREADVPLTPSSEVAFLPPMSGG